jgi:hypothetical protein
VARSGVFAFRIRRCAPTETQVLIVSVLGAKVAVSLSIRNILDPLFSVGSGDF